MNTHGLERTNPKGEKFIGRCIYCGRVDLPMGAALEPCDKAPAQDQQVLDAVGGALADEGERERFIPHLQRCEADDGRGSDFGRCHEYARAVVTTEQGDRYVCDFHKRHWKPGL